MLSGSVPVEKTALHEQIAMLERSALAPRELTRSGDRLARTLLAASVREGLAGMAAHALVVVHDREASRVPWEAMRIDWGWPLRAGCKPQVCERAAYGRACGRHRFPFTTAVCWS